jgi:hypothetical protein
MAFVKGETPKEPKKDITDAVNKLMEHNPEMIKKETPKTDEVIRTGKKGRPRKVTPRESIRITLYPEDKKRFTEWCDLNGTNPSTKAREVLIKFINSLNLR